MHRATDDRFVARRQRTEGLRAFLKKKTNDSLVTPIGTKRYQISTLDNAGILTSALNIILLNYGGTRTKINTIRNRLANTNIHVG